MSLYDDASLIVYPSGYKESKIYAQKPIDGSGDLTFTRASSATRVNEQGLIETASTIGDELVTNGDFATDITGWLQYQSVSTWDSGTIKTTVNSVNAYIRTNTVALTGGIQYKVTFKAKASNVSQNIIIYNGATFFDTGLTFDVANTYQEFTYYLDNIASANLIVGQQSLSIGDSINFDNVSVKEVITSNIPRIDYTGGGCGKLLLEPQRTNLVTYSEDHTQTNNEACTTSGGILAPDGSMNAWKIVEDTTVDQHVCITDNPTNFSAGEVGTCSIYVKAAERTSARIWFHHITTNQYAYVEYNLITGAFIQSGGVNGVFVDSTIVAMDDGWWAVSITGYKNVSTYSWSPAVSPLDSNGDVTYLGDGVSGVYMWGGQTERGASYPTSYIPTSGTTVTRIADSSSTTGLTSVIGQTEGVFYAKIASFTNTSPISSVINISDGSASNQIAIWYGTNLNEFKILIRQSGNKLFHTTTLTDATQFIKVAVLYKSGGSKVYINGSLITSSASPFTFTNPLSVVDFGGIGLGNVDFNGKLQELQLFPSALDDATLATLTTL